MIPLSVGHAATGETAVAAFELALVVLGAVWLLYVLAVSFAVIEPLTT